MKNSTDFELAHAIRGHWTVEVNNHIRDVTLKEDQQRTIKTAITQILATCRTFVINLLNKLKPVNKVAQLELFSDNFDTLIDWLKVVGFL